MVVDIDGQWAPVPTTTGNLAGSESPAHVVDDRPVQVRTVVAKRSSRSSALTLASRVGLDASGGDSADRPSVRGAPKNGGYAAGFVGDFPDGKVVDDLHVDGGGG